MLFVIIVLFMIIFQETAEKIARETTANVIRIQKIDGRNSYGMGYNILHT